MSFTSKFCDRSPSDREEYHSWANDKIYQDRYRREQNGKQDNPALIYAWSIMPIKFRIMWNKKFMGTGFSGYSMFVDRACASAKAAALMQYPGRYTFARFDLAVYG